jgi:hypothetical protein
MPLQTTKLISFRNAYLVVVGDVNTKEVKKTGYFWLLGQGIAPQITYPDPKMCNKLKLIL